MAGAAAGLRPDALLRPGFTGILAEKLRLGISLNLISPHGQGRRRTLEDLRRCLPASMPVLQANLRDYPRSLAAMLAELASQAGLTGMDNLDGLLDRLPQMAERTLIILHNLDELAPGKASGFDDAFFGRLNGIRERPGIALLCVTERMPADWPLQLDAMPLPLLSPDQILAELARRNPSTPTETWPDIAAWMAGQPAAYSLLDQPENWPMPPR